MNVMKKAWEIARNGQKKFGGKVKEYFAQALRIAWQIAKGMTNTIPTLQGSEKQVAWANDIRAKLIVDAERRKELATKALERRPESNINKKHLAEAVAFLEEVLPNIEEATFYINCNEPVPNVVRRYQNMK